MNIVGHSTCRESTGPMPEESLSLMTHPTAQLPFQTALKTIRVRRES